jgi:hypothetical protein
VADLVERGRHDDRDEDREQPRRLIEDRPQAAGDAVDAQQPGVEGQDRGEQHPLERADVQPLEGDGEDVDRARAQERPAVAQREQAHPLRELRSRAVGVREHAERAQLLLGELAHVRDADTAPEVLGDDRGDLLGVTAAVGGGRDLV